MKLAVYTKAGQVGLATIERPQIIEQMMLLSALSVLAFVVRTSGVTVIQNTKRT